MSAPLRLGTRASLLARTQSQLVADLITDHLGVEVRLVEVSTSGDRTTEPLSQLGGTGVFVSALREALLADEVDLCVHSLKDLPTGAAPGITLAAVPSRGDCRDALVARDELTLGELPVGSRVGTGSPRRAAQLHALGLGLEVVDIRGNIDTRLRKVADGEVDAVILALAGLERIGRTSVVTETIDPLQMLPAPGQGALAIECRSTDEVLAKDLGAALEDPHTRIAVDAERSLLATLEAGCAAPVGALAEVVEGDEGDELWIRAVALSPDGSLSIRNSHTGRTEDAPGVGRRLAEDLLADGADQLISMTHTEPPARRQQA